MRLSISAAFIVSAFLASTALAAEKPSGSYRPLGEPQPGEVIKGEIRKEMCVEAHWKKRSPSGYRITMHYPPIKIKVLNAMIRMRARGEVLLKYCELSDS